MTQRLEPEMNPGINTSVAQEKLKLTPSELLWTQAQRSGIERHRFLQLFSPGGASAVLAACTATIVDPSALPTAPASVAEPSTSLL